MGWWGKKKETAAAVTPVSAQPAFAGDAVSGSVLDDDSFKCDLLLFTP